MQRLAKIAAIASCLIAVAGFAAFAAEPQAWPWKTKLPIDPALGLLSRVDAVSVAVSKSEPPIVTVSVKATAPAPNYTDLQLTYRLGDPNDLKFEFDARGRPPQQLPASPQPTSVSIDASYSDAPVAKVKVIEVYAKDNCIAYSLADNKNIDCVVKAPTPQQQTQP